MPLLDELVDAPEEDAPPLPLFVELSMESAPAPASVLVDPPSVKPEPAGASSAAQAKKTPSARSGKVSGGRREERSLMPVDAPRDPLRSQIVQMNYFAFGGW